MIRSIMRAPIFLAQASAPAMAADLPMARDLLEILAARREGCLSLDGVRKAKRYRSIRVRYQNETFETRLKTFTGWTAQIIQHEIDHCNGVLI